MSDAPENDPGAIFLCSQIENILARHHERLIWLLDHHMSELDKSICGSAHKPTHISSLVKPSDPRLSENTHPREIERASTIRIGPLFSSSGESRMSTRSLSAQLANTRKILKPKPITSIGQLEVSTSESWRPSWGSELGPGGTLYERLGRAVRSHKFQLLFTLAIVLHAAFIGVQTQYAASYPGDPSPLGLEAVAHVFTAVFSVELILRVLVYRCSFFYTREWHWNWFDAILVALSWVDTALDAAASAAAGTEAGQGEGGGPGMVRLLRFVRVTRLLRALRIIRVLRHVSGLRALVVTIISTLRSLFWSLVLLLILFYGFGILFTQGTVDHFAFGGAGAAAEGPMIRKHFGGLGKTMFTLFQSITGGISWIAVVEPLGTMGWPWVALFTVYIAFTCFAVLNVITSKFCQTAMDSSQKDQLSLIQAHIEHKEAYLSMVKKLFNVLDTDSSGSISLDEFESHLNNDQTKTYLDSLGLSTDDAKMLFKLIDVDRTQSIDVEEFMMGCLRLRGTAKSIDVATMMGNQRALGRRIREIADSVKALASEQHEMVSQMSPLPPGGDRGTHFA